MNVRTAYLLLVLAAPLAATAQESFPATHIARLDIVAPRPGAGTIGGVAIAAVNTDLGTLQLRVSAAPAGDSPDSLLLLYRNGSSGDLTLGGTPFPPNASTLSLTIPGFAGLAQGALDSGYVWLRVTTRSDHAAYAEGPVVEINSAVTPEPSGREVVPPVDSTDGVASLGLTYDPATKGFRYTAWWLGLSGPATAARIRRGAVGVNGPIVFEMPLTSGFDQSLGMWADPGDELRTAMLNGELYLEVTTAKYPNGELRGQIYPLEGYTAAIEPGNEVPAVSGSTASGSAYLLITAQGTVEAFDKLQGVVGNLSGPINAAHIHRAPIGQNSGPAVTLDIPTPTTLDLELATGSAGGTIAEDIVQDIRATRTYVNVHTATHQSGEARGQLIPARTNLRTGGVGGVQAMTEERPDFRAWYHRSEGTIVFNVDAPEGARRIELFGPDGRLVRGAACEVSRCDMSAGGLPAGPYFARLLEGSRTVACCRVMILP
ncbi:MAG TPA: CHRD domain-containing protein [Candidatus Kapabacteria bacterium]|nr:CHRD domain-containing protein [Candidatus Kapabacteria bacterium]